MEYDNEPTLRDLFDLLRRGLLDAIVVALAAGGVTYLISGMQVPVFEAEATVLASSQDPNQRDFGTSLVTAPALDISSYQSAVTSRPVLAEAFTAAMGASATAQQLQAFENAVTVRTQDANASSVMRLLIRDEDPAAARALANSLANAIVTWDVGRATQSLETIIESLQAQIDSIDTEIALAGAGGVEADTATVAGLERARADLTLQLSSARALRTAAVGRLELLEPAITPVEPVSPNPIRNAALAAALAVFLVYGLRLLRDALDTRVRSVDDLVRLTGLPLLTEFPALATGRRSLPREPSSYLRTSIDFATADAHPKVLLVTSTHQGHGKSSVAMALAENYARQDQRVLLLDADLRKPVIGEEYGLDRRRVGSARQALDDAEAASPTSIVVARDVTVDVVPGFDAAPDPTELLGRGIRRLLDRVSDDYDVIVIDSAPLLPVADTLTIAPFVPGVVLAVSLPDAERKSVENALGLLGRLNVRVLGTVATNLPKPSRRNGGAYGYGYGYGYGAGYGQEQSRMANASGGR